jgi:hypothetical protein
MPQQQYSQGQLDAIARQRGFHDYATWAAWNAHRSAGLQQPSGQPAQTQAQPNFLMSLINKIPWHPSYLLNHVNNAMQNAQNGNGQ